MVELRPRAGLAAIVCAVVGGACTTEYDAFSIQRAASSASGPGSGSTSSGNGTGAVGASGGVAGAPTVGGAPPAGSGGEAGALPNMGAGGSGGMAGSGGTGGSPIASCTSQYGAAPGFVLCKETSTECEFSTVLDSLTSCTAVCGGLGGECMTVWRNGAACEYLPQETCGTTAYYDVICVCSLGCGSGPACGAGQTCAAGSCS